MKYIKQFTIILVLSFLGEILNRVIPLPVPASIYGILLMFFSLVTGLIKVEQVKEASMFMIEIMPLVFIPAAVGLVDSWGLISDSWYMYVVVLFVTTVVVMAVSGLTTQLVMRHGTEKRKGGGDHA